MSPVRDRLLRPGKTGRHAGDAGEAAVGRESAPAEAAAARDAATVEIPVEKQQFIGVKTTTAQVLPLMKTIRTVGLVEYDQRRLNTINTKVEGWVEKLYVNFTGAYVKKGDPVADIYSPELWATQQEFINVVRWAKGARAKNSGQAGRTADARRARHKRHDRPGRAVPRRGRPPAPEALRYKRRPDQEDRGERKADP